MANHSVIAFGYLNIFNNGICGELSQSPTASNFSISDISSVFDRYKQENTDIINIGDRDIGVISLFVKRIIDSGIDVSDNSNQYVYYRPSFNEIIEFSDASEGHIWTPQNAEDTFLIGTNAHIDVHYNNVDSELSTIILSDTSFSIISRLLTREFKNSLYPFLSTTEETVYTCNSETSTILNISICNVILTPIIVSVMIYKGGITQTYLIKNIEVPTASCFIINNNGESAILLEKDDEIRIISDTINSSDVYIAMFEQS